MLSRSNSMVWNMDGKDEEAKEKEVMGMEAISTFKSMLEVDDNQDWYLTDNNNNGGGGSSSIPSPNNCNYSSNMHGQSELRDLSFPSNFNESVDQNPILNQIDFTASCSPSPVSVFNRLDQSQVQQNHFFLQPYPPPKANMLSGLGGGMSSTQFDNTGFNLGFQSGFLGHNHALGGSFASGFSELNSQNQMGVQNLSPNPQFSTAHLLQMPQNPSAFGSFGFGDQRSGNAYPFIFNNRAKLLQPLDNFASTGTQPTLFQKRAALRKNLGNNNNGNSGVLSIGVSNNNKQEVHEFSETKSFGEEFTDPSIDGSFLNYDSDDLTENTTTNQENEEGVKNGDDSKGKKKGLPAKNLMAERRRRKKLNDRLYMLRSVVPKISKMDRASILGDAIEYLKELLQKINDLQNELESSPSPASALTPTSFYPLTPPASVLTSHIKEELCPSPFASPLPSPTGQPVRVDVSLREGRAFNIHMFCGNRQGLLVSTMRTLEALGLDIQQAVISCFSGFVLDIFRAELRQDGQDVSPEQIRALLLDSAGF